MTKSRFVCIECDTNHMATKPPSEPKFHKTVMYPNGDRARIKVTWQPDIKGNPGSHFYVQYRKSGEIHFRSTNEELNEDSVVVGMISHKMSQKTIFCHRQQNQKFHQKI